MKLRNFEHCFVRLGVAERRREPMLAEASKEPEGSGPFALHLNPVEAIARQ